MCKSIIRKAGVAVLLTILTLSTVRLPVRSAAVKLSLNSVILTKGDQIDLDVEGIDEKTGTYASLNTSVATVDRMGVVTAKKAGAAKITWSKGSKKLTCKLKVTKAPSLKTCDLFLRTGERCKVSISRHGNSSLRAVWSSKNSDIASVDNGTIHGVSAGATTVTARICGNHKCWTRKVNVRVADWENQELSFPASEYGLTEYNMSVFGIDKFTVSIDMPAEWETYIPSEYTGEGLPDGHSPVEIVCGNKHIGTIDFDIFEPPAGNEQASNYYRMVYNQIMLGSVASWDCDYTPVKKAEHFESATCRIMADNVEAKDYKHGILAYDSTLGVYIKISFDDPMLDVNIRNGMAESISFLH